MSATSPINSFRMAAGCTNEWSGHHTSEYCAGGHVEICDRTLQDLFRMCRELITEVNQTSVNLATLQWNVDAMKQQMSVIDSRFDVLVSAATEEERSRAMEDLVDILRAPF